MEAVMKGIEIQAKEDYDTVTLDKGSSIL